MKEKFGNMWDWEADAYCITTNGIIRKDGRAVMGAGVALSALKLFKECDICLANFIKKNGHVVGVFSEKPITKTDLISFPTKYHWKDPSDIDLIIKSSRELMSLIEERKYGSVVLPRPGCANGGLNWNDVKKEIQPILDDRVVVFSL